MPFSALPVPPKECEAVGCFLDSLTTAAVARLGLTVDVFIHMAGLQHKDGSAIRFSSKGKDWLPKLGLGVWPDRPAPTIWTPEEFDNLVPGQKPRTLRNHVFEISRSDSAREEARKSMLGWGSVIQVLRRKGEPFLERARQALLPRITDPCFNCFPFYVPLLDRKSLTHQDPSEMKSWLCGASIYIRESPEDSGLLIISAERLEPVLKVLDARAENPEQTLWKVPV